jgi:hypothetical protein
MMAERDHNAQHLLVIRQLPAGWYVVRVCACHYGDTVSFPYPSAERAARVRQVILGEVTTRSEPKLTWLRTGQAVTILDRGGDN